MALINAQSIRNKMDLFRVMIANEKLDIVGITESWVHEETRDYVGEYEIPGYKLFKKDRLGKEGGGILLYVREFLNPIDCNIESNHEMLGVSLNNLEKCMYIYLVYRPPHQPQEVDEDLYNKLGGVLHNKLCVILGDFNGAVNWDTMTSKSGAEGTRLLEFVKREFLYQWVDKPTRGNNVLDLVLSTEDNIISELMVGEKLGNSDHNIVRFNADIPHTKEFKTLRKLDFRRPNFIRLRELVGSMTYEENGDIDAVWESFKTEHHEKRNVCIPYKKISSTGNPQPKWFSSEIANKIKERDRAHAHFKQNPLPEHNTSHRKLCREVDKLVRRAKRNEESRIAAAVKSNPKEFFSYVNSRKPIKNSIGPLKNENGRIVSKDLEMAELLNKYFTSVFTRRNTSASPEAVIKYEGEQVLDKIVFTVEDIKTKIRKLNKYKAPGPDEFYPRVIKELESEIAPHFYNIYRLSVSQRKAAKDWKLANVPPIHKGGSKNDPGNYRPISLTSVVCKILESIIVDLMTEHIEANGLLLDSQHGFRHNRSCLSNLVDFFHNMFSIYDSSRAIDILYLDFQKAFDKVPHDKLMIKVRALGIVGEIADWIEDWLRNRKQRVVINGEASEWADVTSGVPQGSVLGPLLFIIYINDIDVGLVSRIAKFADDTKLGIDAGNKEEIQGLQADLGRLGEWSEKWQMPFNVNKCKVMHIGYNNPNSRYNLLGNDIECVQQEKDLGVIISNDLKFSKQCINVEKKAQKLIGYIKRQFRNRNKEIVIPLYNALVRPHLEYAVQFWCPTLRMDIERLEAVQARATKLIPSIRNLNHERRRERLNLFSLETRRLRGQLIETFKIFKGMTKINHANIFTLSNNQTRNNGWKIDLKRYNTSLCGNFFTYKIGSTWNQLPADVVGCETVEQFKRELDRIIHRLI